MPPIVFQTAPSLYVKQSCTGYNFPTGIALASQAHKLPQRRAEQIAQQARNEASHAALAAKVVAAAQKCESRFDNEVLELRREVLELRRQLESAMATQIDLKKHYELQSIFFHEEEEAQTGKKIAADNAHLVFLELRDVQERFDKSTDMYTREMDVQRQRNRDKAHKDYADIMLAKAGQKEAEFLLEKATKKLDVGGGPIVDPETAIVLDTLAFMKVPREAALQQEAEKAEKEKAERGQAENAAGEGETPTPAAGPRKRCSRVYIVKILEERRQEAPCICCN
jgi:hypothetical protein